MSYPKYTVYFLLQIILWHITKIIPRKGLRFNGALPQFVCSATDQQGKRMSNAPCFKNEIQRTYEII